MSQWSSVPLASITKPRVRHCSPRRAIIKGGSVSEPLNPVSRITSISDSRPSTARTGRRMVASVCAFTTPMIIASHALAAPRGSTRCAAPHGGAKFVRADDGPADVQWRYNHRGRSHTLPSQCRSPRTGHRPPPQGGDGYHAHRWSVPAGQTLLRCSVVPTRSWSYSYSDTRDLSGRVLLCGVLVYSTPFRIAAFV